jgi:signal transduction histidine kinase
MELAGASNPQQQQPPRQRDLLGNRPQASWPVEHLPYFWRLLNFLLVAALLLLYLCFARPGGVSRSHVEFWLLILGTIAQAVVVLVFTAFRIPQRSRRRSSPISTAINLLLALGLAMSSPLGDVQCAVLMLPPVIVAAFRYSLPQAVLLATLAGMMTLLAPGFHFSVYHDLTRAMAFNAAALAASEVLVAVVVWLFTSALRTEQARLRITEAKLAEEERLAAVGRLAAGIAHEIRNPVAMIASSLDMAANDATPAETRSEMSQIAREESARLTKLTNDFLTYARGKPPQRRAFPACGIVEYLADVTQARAVEAQVGLKTECQSNLEANGDELQLQQAMLNLAMNAIDATPPGGLVTFGARATVDGTVELFVQNTGDAIPVENVPRLFEPFFTTKSHGTGLGLSISRSIAAAHGGDLQLTTNRPGQVCFSLMLPPPQRTDAEGSD